MKQSSRLLAVAAVSIAIALVGAGPFVPASSHASGYQGTITMDAGAYNPPIATVAAPGQTVIPHYALQNLAKKWAALHPGVTIKFVHTSVPTGQNANDVQRAQLTAGASPDVFAMWGNGQAGQLADQFLRAGLIVDLAPYMAKPNKYVRGNKHWIDLERTPYQYQFVTPQGKIAAPALDAIGTGIYYNKSITSKLGIMMPPPTWAALLDDMAKIKKAGYLVFSGSPGNWVQDWWIWGMVSRVTMHNDIAKFAVLKYQPNYTPGVVTVEDWARAVSKMGWRPSKDPGFLDMVKVVQSVIDYTAPGWNSASGGNPFNLFVQGRLAMYWGTSFDYPQMKNDKQRTFPFGTFWWPRITQETVALAPQPPITNPGVGGLCCDSYAVAHTVANNPAKLTLAIDWLQYITTPSADTAIVDEVPTEIPAIVGAKGAPGTENFFIGETSMAKSSTHGQWPLRIVDAFAGHDYNTFFKDAGLYLQGDESLQQLLSQSDALVVHSAQTLVAQNDKSKVKGGTWDLTKW